MTAFLLVVFKFLELLFDQIFYITFTWVRFFKNQSNNNEFLFFYLCNKKRFEDQCYRNNNASF